VSNEGRRARPLEIDERTLYLLRERHSLDKSRLPRGVKTMDVNPMQRSWWYVVMQR